MIHQENTAENNSEGCKLLRLILVDSLSTGRIIDFPLDGGAVLTGRNGRGKTSLLQLLLLFYGESPNKIVTTEAGRESFVGYYLPRTTSYIVFEYQRHAGHKRMVVAYADKAGERVLYRFVRSGYEVTQFVQGNGEFVKVADFRRHIQMCGIQCSERQIESQTEYRNVIQGVPSNTTDKSHSKYLRELIQEYSFTTSGQPLRQIEKIVSGMFRRKTNFDDLQSMVIDCVTDEQASHAISGDRKKIEDWPRGYKAYMSVMALAPKMERAEQADSQLQAAELELGQICARFRSLMAHLDQEIHQKTNDEAQTKSLVEQEQEQHTEKSSEISLNRQHAQRNNQFANSKVHELEKARDDYEKQDIRALDARVKNSQNLRDRRSQADERRKTLLGEQKEVSAKFEGFKQEERELFNQFREAQIDKRQRISEDFDRNLRQLEEKFEAVRKAAEENVETERRHLDDAVQAANTEQGRRSHAMNHPDLDEKTLELFERKKENLEVARSQKVKVDDERRARDEARSKASRDFERQEDVVSSARRSLTHAEQNVVHKESRLIPKEKSLLHFLRTENSGWGADIAKVIRGELLDRTDLEPAMVDSNNTVFGLSLNLERLDSHSASDVVVAQRELDLAKEHVEMAQATLDKALSDLAQLAKVRELAETARKAHEVSIHKANTQVAFAQTEVEEAKRQVEANRKSAVADAKRLLDVAHENLRDAKAKLTQFDQLARAQAREKRDRYDQTKQEKQKKRDDEIKLLQAGIDARRSQLDSKLKQLDVERDETLRSKGINTPGLKKIEEEIAEIDKEIQAIDSFREKVEEWRHWEKNEWPKHGGFKAKAQAEHSAFLAHEQALAEIYAQWKKRSHELQDQIKQLRQDVSVLQGRRKSVSERIEKMTDYPEVCIPAYDETWTFDSLLSRANDCTKDANRLQGEIRLILGELASGFRLHQGTPPEQYLQTSLGSLSPVPNREWMQPFKTWFSTSHQEYRRILLMDAVSIAGEVVAFHRSMNEFHLRVQQFNRELQEHLDTSLAFESISKIGVEVVSTIKELKYWATICDIEQAYREWNVNLSNELPPPEFSLKIERLLEHWEVKAGIRADLKSLIRIQGEVTENANRRVFRRAADLEAVSSNGLSYLILATIFVAFINRIRRNAKVNIVWALDELKDLDAANVIALVDLLEQNNITLACAFPDPDPETMALFKHRFTVEPDRRLAEVRVALEYQIDEPTDVLAKDTELEQGEESSEKMTDSMMGVTSV